MTWYYAIRTTYRNLSPKTSGSVSFWSNLVRMTCGQCRMSSGWRCLTPSGWHNGIWTLRQPGRISLRMDNSGCHPGDLRCCPLSPGWHSVISNLRHPDELTPDRISSEWLMVNAGYHPNVWRCCPMSSGWHNIVWAQVIRTSYFKVISHPDESWWIYYVIQMTWAPCLKSSGWDSDDCSCWLFAVALWRVHRYAVWKSACCRQKCYWYEWYCTMMASSNGNIFRVTGPLCGEFTGPGEFPTQRPVRRSFDVSFDLRLTKRLSKQPWGWWFETPSWSLWRQCNDGMYFRKYFREANMYFLKYFRRVKYLFLNHSISISSTLISTTHLGYIHDLLIRYILPQTSLLHMIFLVDKYVLFCVQENQTSSWFWTHLRRSPEQRMVPLSLGHQRQGWSSPGEWKWNQ